MAGTTSNNSWPYPTSTDLVTNGASAIQSLATSIDTSTGKGLIAWQAWTPTVSGGFTVGNGSWSNAIYCQIGKTVHFTAVFTYGSTSSANTMNVSLPVTARVAASQMNNGYCNAGGNAFSLTVRMNTTSNVQVYANGSAVAYVNLANLTTLIPGTWATGNILAINGTYEAA